MRYGDPSYREVVCSSALPPPFAVYHNSVPTGWRPLVPPARPDEWCDAPLTKTDSFRAIPLAKPEVRSFRVEANRQINAKGHTTCGSSRQDELPLLAMTCSRG